MLFDKPKPRTISEFEDEGLNAGLDLTRMRTCIILMNAETPPFSEPPPDRITLQRHLLYLYWIVVSFTGRRQQDMYNLRDGLEPLVYLRVGYFLSVSRGNANQRRLVASCFSTDLTFS